MTRQTVTIAQARDFVRTGDLDTWARRSATFNFEDERAQRLDKAAHGYIYSMPVTNPGIIFEAYLDHRSALSRMLAAH